MITVTKWKRDLRKKNINDRFLFFLPLDFQDLTALAKELRAVDDVRPQNKVTDYSSSSEESDTTDEDDDEEVDQEAGEESTSGPEDTKAVYVTFYSHPVTWVCKNCWISKCVSRLFQTEQWWNWVSKNHDRARWRRERQGVNALQGQHSNCQTGTTERKALHSVSPNICFLLTFCFFFISLNFTIILFLPFSCIALFILLLLHICLICV